MPVRWLTPSRFLSTESFVDFEQFRPNEVIGGGISKPTDPSNFSAHRAVLPLQDSLLVLQRSFARRLQADMGTDKGVGLVIPIAFHSIANKETLDNSTIAVLRGRVATEAVEEHPNTYLMLRFDSDMSHRGWMDSGKGLSLIRPARPVMNRLKESILDIFCFASTCNDATEFGLLQGSLRESLYASLDAALIPCERTSVGRRGTFEAYRKLVAELDEQISLLKHSPLYSDDLALRLHVSVRTLQNAVRTMHGVNLHHYIRSKRLWEVRKQLQFGPPAATIKNVAMANGFWHMGDFSVSYKSAFGESPSATRLRRQYF